MLGPLRTASRLLWSWAIGRVLMSDSSGPVTTLQAQFTGDRLLDRAKLLQHFGFASRPPAQSDVVAICPSGEPSSAIVIGSNHQQHRPPTLQEGDAALYDVRGAYWLMGANGPVLDAAGGKVVVQNASAIEVTGTDHVTITAPNATVSASTAIKLDSPNVEATHNLQVDGAPTGTFTSKEGRVITVTKGIVTAIV